MSTNTLIVSIIALLLSSCNNTNQKDHKDANTRRNQFDNTDNFFERISSKNKINDITYRNLSNNSKSLPTYNEFESYFIVDTSKIGPITRLSLIHKDESCCKSLYYLTFLDLKKNVVDSRLVAKNGSDGDWSEIDKIKINNNKTIVTKIITQQISNEETGNYEETIKDSITVLHNITDKGIIQSVTTDSMRTHKIIK